MGVGHGNGWNPGPNELHQSDRRGPRQSCFSPVGLLAPQILEESETAFASIALSVPRLFCHSLQRLRSQQGEIFLSLTVAGSVVTIPRRLMRNEIRIIAGSWRSRKLRFPPSEGLRPTPDRVRETLFNWLRDDIQGARCLDLFAGSGALGFEAASRGAARVVMVEADARVCAALQQNCALLSADQVRVVKARARDFLRESPAESFDVVFLDPPYRRGWLPPLCSMLEARGWLSPGALLYLERERESRLDGSDNWRCLREGEAGEVAYGLYQRQA